MIRRILSMLTVFGSSAFLYSSALLIPSFALADAVYQPSETISGIEFHMSTLRNRAPGNGGKCTGVGLLGDYVGG